MTKFTHTVPSYFVQPDHPITIFLVGCGGTGSLLLVRLAKIHKALVGLGYLGLQVTVFDPDKVSASNIGRQNFFDADVGKDKARVLVERVNRAFGTAWEAVCNYFPNGSTQTNIIISCVDSVASRRKIYEVIKEKGCLKAEYMTDLCYWMDIGNSKSSGQVILGTLTYLDQPKDLDTAIGKLPHVFDLYPNMEKHEKPDQPSCSMAEALLKQDLFINEAVSLEAGKIIWNMLRKYRLDIVGAYVNLDTCQVTGIPVQVPDMKWYKKKEKKSKINKGLAAVLPEEHQERLAELHADAEADIEFN